MAQVPVSLVAQGLCSGIQLSTLNKEPSCPQSPELEVGGLWKFLSGISVPEHDGDGSTMSKTSYVPKFSFLH